jgi:hypothetical protein
MLKRGARILALDDGPLDRPSVPVAGVVARLNAPEPGELVEGFLLFTVRRDGTDAGRAVARAVKRSRFAPQLRALLVNSITLGGLNLLDLPRLHRELRLPILAVTRKPPTPGRLASALRAARQPRKLSLVARAGEAHPFRAGWFHAAGIAPPEARRLLDSFGGYPWPLRLAHLAATAAARGESGGRA